jgi:hypothetical protein
MTTENGTSADQGNGFEQRFEGLREGLKKLAHQFDTTPEGYLGKIKNQIKEHPLAAVGIAFGVGYLVMRMARRR